MKQHLNTLFLTTDGLYLAREGQSVVVRGEDDAGNRVVKLRLPVHTLGSIVCFGRIGASPSLMQMCGESGVGLSFLTGSGRFMARVTGFTPGNVLLRRQQYRVADDSAASVKIVGPIVLGKIANQRAVLLRAMRENLESTARPAVERAAALLAGSIRMAEGCGDVARLRGIEGDAARVYFDVFDHLITKQKTVFHYAGRSRRPPLDNVNALLSFLYSLLAADARCACECAGLDPAVGFLHVDRPGRPSLALDLMEELRPLLADRLALSLINRQQIDGRGFVTTESGAVRMTDATRKKVIVAWQKRKQKTLLHPFLGEKVTVGLLVHLQARLLARHLRGDADVYAAFIWK
ncbi:MAG TPA: type I-C CRISPR-associated endonuclease Cas1c [Tepidisphaeraceae bacterium]|jgi:CRISPR-associated protein Cas1